MRESWGTRGHEQREKELNLERHTIVGGREALHLLANDDVAVTRRHSTVSGGDFGRPSVPIAPVPQWATLTSPRSPRGDDSLPH